MADRTSNHTTAATPPPNRGWIALAGAAAGLLNGLFGAGGGLAAVPLLGKAGLLTKAAHATSIAVILPISLISLGGYLMAGHVAVGDGLRFLPGSLLGAAAGGLLMRKIPPIWLRRIFGGFLIWAAVRMFLR